MKTICLCLALATSAMAAQQLRSNSVDATNIQAGTAKKSFAFHGVVESVDAKAGRVTVNNEKIEGWMDAMTMAYSVDKPADLEKVKSGDRIEATVYQDDYKLYDIKVVGRK